MPDQAKRAELLSDAAVVFTVDGAMFVNITHLFHCGRGTRRSIARALHHALASGTDVFIGARVVGRDRVELIRRLANGAADAVGNVAGEHRRRTHGMGA